MHELSIAMNILEIAESEAARHEGRPIAVHIKLGALAGVVREALLSAWELARCETSFAAAELIVEETPIVGECPSCGGVRGVISIQDFRCTDCGAAIGRVVGGRELEVTALELDS
jgi:hydrogenase nickel incorporation protein HypA/HybF